MPEHDSGYIGLYRELLEKPIWQNSTPEQKTILITLLLMANHQEKEWEWKGQKFKARPGQFVTSLDSIQKKCGKGITQQNIRTALKRFAKLEFLTDESTKTGRLITIVNWDVYQVQRLRANKDTNSYLTKTSQRPNKDLTPNNNDNNDKKININKKIYGDYVQLTDEEYSKLVERFGQEATQWMIEKLDNAIGAKGYKYKSHYRAILNWVKDEYYKTHKEGRDEKGRGHTGKHASPASAQPARKYPIRNFAEDLPDDFL